MTDKTCTKCKVTKHIDEFYAPKSVGRHLAACKSCHRIAKSIWRKANPERVAELIANWEKKNPLSAAQRTKKWRQKNPEAARAADTRQKSKPEQKAKRTQYLKEWQSDNKHKLNEYAARRRVLGQFELNDDQRWFMSEAYDIAKKRSVATGIKWHVDHIIPIKNSKVCGLHVPWNIQVITEAENKAKRNYFEGQM